MNLLRWIKPGLVGFFVMLFVVINGSTLFPETDIMIIMAAGLAALALTIVAVYKVLPDGKKKITVPDREYRPAFLLSLAVGTVTVMIFSKSSPLYPLNTWTDSNCFFTIGAAALKGRVTYRDIFDHKGPLLYLLHTLAAIISRDTFFGVFIIQVIFCSLTHYYALKTVSLYRNVNRASLLCSVPLMFLSFSVLSYYYGDSAEEFLLPFYTMALYVVIRSIRKNRYPDTKDIILVGIGGAFSFWIKYTLSGYFLAVILYLIIAGIVRKEYKKILRAAAVFALTCIAVSAVVLIYAVFANCLGDMFTVYFDDTIFLYKDTSESMSIIGRIPYTLTLTLIRLGQNPYFAVMILLAVIYLLAKGKKGETAYYLSAFCITCMFIFLGGFQGFYYPFALAVFTVPAWPVIFNLADKIKKIPLVSLMAVVLSTCAFLCSTATPGLLGRKEDMPQYIFAGYINASSDRSLLNYGFLDQGFFTAAGITPTEKYFFSSNIDAVLTEATVSKEEAITEGRIMFIVTKNHEYEWENYELVTYADWTERDFDNEDGTDRYYLYRRID